MWLAVFFRMDLFCGASGLNHIDLRGQVKWRVSSDFVK
jgi:hypothetical protein